MAETTSGYDRVLKGEQIDGWRLVLDRDGLIGDYRSNHALVTMAWCNATDESMSEVSRSEVNRSEVGQLAEAGVGAASVVVRTVDALPERRQVLSLRRYTLTRPTRWRCLLRVVFPPAKWCYKYSFHLTRRLVASVFQRCPTGHYRLIVVDAFGRSGPRPRMFTLQAPDGRLSLRVMFLDENRKRLFALYRHVDVVASNLPFVNARRRTFELSLIGYDWPEIDQQQQIDENSPNNNIIQLSMSSWQSIAINVGDRNRFFSFRAGDRTLLTVVYRQFGRAEQHRCVAFHPVRGCGILYMLQVNLRIVGLCAVGYCWKPATFGAGWVGSFADWIRDNSEAPQMLNWRSFDLLRAPTDRYLWVRIDMLKIISMFVVHSTCYVITKNGVLRRWPPTFVPKLLALTLDTLRRMPNSGNYLESLTGIHIMPSVEQSDAVQYLE